MADSSSSAPKTAVEQFKDMATSKTDAAQTPERSLWTGGYSPKAMYGSWVITALITVAVLVAVALFGKEVEFVW
ncbi:MAG: hypothetical protein U0930_25775 [Pirellulales bacterium]